jgi:hypothetical protein
VTGAQILTLFLAVVAACGASLVTGLLTRPKTKAEAEGIAVTGEVAISGDARAWAKQFAERAATADARAQRAEDKAEEIERRCDDLENKFGLLVTYTRSLQGEITTLGGHPSPPPTALIPPLDHI